MSLITATKLLTNAHIGVDNSRKLHEFLASKGCSPAQNGAARGTFYQEAKASMLMPEFLELIRAGAKRKSTVGKAQVRSKPRSKPAADVKMLLVLEVGQNESITLTAEKAQSLYRHLHKIFGSD